MRGIGTAATGMIAFSAGTQVVTAALLWTSVDPASDLAANFIALFVQLVGGVLFVAWMRQARLNSDTITSRHQHRWTNMWVQPMVGLQKRPQSGLVTAWWLSTISAAGLVVAAVLAAQMIKRVNAMQEAVQVEA